MDTLVQIIIVCVGRVEHMAAMNKTLSTIVLRNGELFLLYKKNE